MTVKTYENTIHKDLIQPLKEECSRINDFVTQSIKTHKDGKYTTFWFEKDDEPKTLIEYIAKSISIKDFSNGFPDNYVGFEWWVQEKDTKENITFHYDKDEGLSSQKNEYIYPIHSTITYLTNVGGPTTIFNDENYDNGYLSFPKVNKHVVFDGHLFHGVIGPLSKIKPTKDSKRITFLINYWYQKPIEPNCIVFPYDKFTLIPLTEEHEQLQESTTKEKSKILLMKYKNGYNNYTIYRNKTPIIVSFAKLLKSMTTYSFKFRRKDKVVSVQTFSSF